MTTIKPFKGYIPKPELAEKIASPPYDVLSSDEARVKAENNPLSFLHVVKSEIDFEVGESISKEEIYKKGRKNLEKLINDGSLIKNPKPCFYLYQLQMKGHVQTGLVCGASCDEYDSGIIKKHEFTRPDKEDDRAKHIEVLNANAGPVFLTCKKSNSFEIFVNEFIRNEPVINFIADDNIRHKLWIINGEKEIERIIDIFTNINELYVADGHHRSAAASRVMSIKKENNPNHTGEEQYNYFLSVIFPEDQMMILDYNRVVKDLNGFSVDEIIKKIAETFYILSLDIRDPEKAKPTKRGDFSMYLEDKWYKLTIKKDYIPKNDPVKSLDVALLQNYVLEPILGIDDPRTNTRIDFVGGIRGMGGLERRCQNDSKIAFALYPTGIDQLMAIADQGKVMPPKSTWFEPKLRSGMVVRMLEE